MLKALPRCSFSRCSSLQRQLLSKVPLTSHPVYIMVHSSETGECPAGQCQYPIFLSVSPKHYMMIQLMNTYLHCLNSIEDNIPLTV
jgi:hypothetical protein